MALKGSIDRGGTVFFDVHGSAESELRKPMRLFAD
jgi:hypothetical protein